MYPESMLLRQLSEGYRLLLRGDVIAETDEQLRGHDRVWVKTTLAGWPITYNERWMPPIRRKIEVPKE